MRIIFAGTPDFAAANLQALLDAGIQPIAVYSQPDRPKGRGKKLIPTPVKAVALEHDIPVYQPLNFKADEDLNKLKSLDADLMIVVAYGLLLPKAVLEAPKFGCINVHASVLPRWRGAAPIERAIEAGDLETGVTIMQMDEGLDTGDMLKVVTYPIDDATTGDALREMLKPLGAKALIEVLEQIQQQSLKPEVQNDDLASYAKKMSKAEAEIDWQNGASSILRKIHAFNSANACFTMFGEDRIKIFSVQLLEDGVESEPGSIVDITKKSLVVACGEKGQQRLALKEMQLPNAKRMPTASVLNGKRDFFAQGQCFKRGPLASDVLT